MNIQWLLWILYYPIDNPLVMLYTMTTHSSLAVGCRRQNLFNAWLGGLFMVAPFVDVLMQFVVPLLVASLVETLGPLRNTSATAK